MALAELAMELLYIVAVLTLLGHQFADGSVDADNKWWKRDDIAACFSSPNSSVPDKAASSERLEPYTWES